MTRDELLNRLRELALNHDIEEAHIEADKALLAFIGDDDIREAFMAIRRWYA